MSFTLHLTAVARQCVNQDPVSEVTGETLGKMQR